MGEVHENGMTRMIMDQLTDGQLDWVRLEDPYDVITLGDKDYELYSGKQAFVEELERQFPNEKKAIKEFMRLSSVREDAGFYTQVGHLKVLGLKTKVPGDHFSLAKAVG